MHEQKNCPRCSQAFTCKAGSIALCDCSTLALGSQEREWIKEKFTGCLCRNCLEEIKNNYFILKDLPVPE
jgi:hypothetical protein